MTTHPEGGGFGSFFRRYTKTWMHAVATAGLTAFGTLTIVHRGFVVLALASYVVPPIVLYLSRARGSDEPATDAGGQSQSPTDAALTDRSNADRTETVTGGAGGTHAGDTDTDDTEDEPEADREWTTVDTPIETMLFDGAIAADASVAVGDGGVVLVSSDGWGVALEDGPGTQGRDLHAVDATADGDVVWVAGDGGALGRLTIETGRHTDYSAPADRTDNLTGLAVSGATGDETILLTNGSGEVLRGRYRDGDLTWEQPIKPGSGSSLAGVTLDDGVGYCCDTNDGVFETTDGGETFEPIGIDGAEGTLTDVTAGRQGECHVSTDTGVLHRYDVAGTWTPDRVTDRALLALAGDDDRLVTTADDGTIYDRHDPTGDWDEIETDGSGALHGVAVGPTRSVAVGVEGTIVEKT